MGRRGPPKTPVATLKARGTFRKDRHSDDVEKQLESKVPSPPEHLDHEQRELWDRIGNLLAARGLLTELDGMALELLVGSYVGMNDNCRALSDEPLIYFTDSGSAMANPRVGVISKQTNLLRWCLREFGCTPSARTGIKVEKRDLHKGDPMAALLSAASADSPNSRRPSAPKRRASTAKRNSQKKKSQD